MSAKQDRLIAEQQTYLDMVTALEPYRRVTVSDRANAQVELLQMRAELAALRAQAALLDDYAETIRQHEIRIAELEQAVSEAREIIERGATVYTGSANHNSAFNATCRAWLASHAPAQQEQEQAE